MVVLAIVALVVTTIIPRINNRNNELKATVRRFSTLTKQLHAMSKLRDSTYRIVIDMKNGEKANEAHEYWVEEAKGTILLKEGIQVAEPLDPYEKEEERKKKRQAGGFSMATKILNGKKQLPNPLVFTDVEIVGVERPITEGEVYLYFYPSGLAQEAAIHIKADEKLQWTVAIHPLTGKADIVPKNLSLKEIRDR